MIYLFLGNDLAAKDARIAAIKNKLFKNSQGALAFDFDNLDAVKLPDDVLKKSLLTLPVIAPFRLIILRQVHKLKISDVQVLLTFCQKPAEYCDLILDSSEKMLKGDLKDLPRYAKSEVLARPEGPGVFDMTKLITAGQSAQALKMLNGFYAQNVYPLQIMPALVWYWGKEGRSCGKEVFKRGLKALQEADLNIKRSRFDPQYTIEKLVVELSLLRQR
jgi:DNA polymerase III delta subunit